MFLENVRGHLSLGWDTVLCDLHDLGYNVRWTLLRAADVGAAHNRARLFAVAADRAAYRWAAPSGWPVARIADGALNAPHDGLFGAHPLPLAENGHVPMWSAGLMVDGAVWEQDALLGTAQYEVGPLLPTPAVNDMGKAYTPEEWDAWCDKQRAAHGNGNGHGPSLEIEAARMGDGATNLIGDTYDSLAPDAGQDLSGLWNDVQPKALRGSARGPRSLREAPMLQHVLRQHPSGGKGGDLALAGSSDAGGGLRDLSCDDRPTCASRRQDTDEQRSKQPTDALRVVPPALALAGRQARWGRYATAIARCELILGRTAPDPTSPTDKDKAHRLSPAFAEFLMMLPAGWVTDPALWTHLSAGAARNVQLKLLGNGCVPAQAAAAWRHLTVGLRVARVAA